MKINKLVQPGVIYISTFLFLLSVFGLAAEKKKEIKPENAGKPVLIIADKKLLKYYLTKSQKSLMLHLRGPGKLAVSSRAILLSTEKKSVSYSLIGFLDGKRVHTFRVKRAKLSIRARLKKSTAKLSQRKSFNIYLQRGHHTLLIRTSSETIPIVMRFSFSSWLAKKRKWQYFHPLSPLEPTHLLIREKEVEYLRFSQKKPIRLNLIGPVTLRIFIRLENHYNFKKSALFRLLVKRNQQTEKSYYLRVGPSQLANYKKKHYRKILSKAVEIVLPVPAGLNRYIITPLDKLGGSFLGRFMFARGLPISKQILGKGKRTSSLKTSITPGTASKTTWIPVRVSDSTKKARLVEGKRTTTYYHFKHRQPFRVAISGPTSLKIQTRVENTYKMKGKIRYRIQVKQKGRVLKTYQFESTKSETVFYKSEKTKIPGQLKEVEIKVPSGKQNYEIISLDRDKQLLARVLTPSSALTHSQRGKSMEQKKKWYSLDPATIQKTEEFLISGKGYYYYRVLKNQPVKARVIGPTIIKVLSRVAGPFKKKEKIVFGLRVKERGKIVTTDEFEKPKSNNASYKEPARGALSIAGVMTIKVPKGEHTYTFLPTGSDSKSHFIRFFVADRGAILPREILVKPAKPVPIPPVKIKPATKKPVQIKSPRQQKWKFHFFLQSLYDSNILRYSDKYYSRFQEQSSSDTGRFNITSFSDLVFYGSFNATRSIRRFKNLRTNLTFDGFYYLYSQNSIKNWAQFDLALQQQLSYRLAMQLSATVLPHYYIRHYRDLDLVEEIGYEPETFQPMEFSRNSISLGLRYSLFKKTKIRSSYNYLVYSYNDSFSEYNSRDSRFGLGFETRLTKKLTLRGTVRYRVSEADGFDEPGEEKSNSDDSDPSYIQTDYLAGIFWRIPRIFNRRNTLRVSLSYYNRRYTSNKPVESDPLHTGRRDYTWRIFITYSIRLKKAFYLSLFYNWNQRFSERDFIYEKLDISAEKNYKQSRIGLRISYYLIK